MSIRSKLFATVALPMLSISIVVPPALADSLTTSFEVAQEDGAAQLPEEELLRKKRRENAEQVEEQPAAEAQEEQPAAEEQPRRKRRKEAEQQQEQPQQEAQPAQEEQQPSRAERRKRQQAEQQQTDEAQPTGDDEAAKAAEERRRIRAERKKQQAEQQQPSEEVQPSGDDEAAKAAEERAKIRAERKKKQAEQQPSEDAQPSGDDEAAKAAEERAKIRAERRKRQAEQQQTEEATPSTEDDAAQKAAEERRRIRAEQKARADAENQEQGKQPVAEEEVRPSTDGDSDSAEGRKRPDRRKPIPEVVDERTTEEKQEIARDPAKSDETVVLPVENGAAVLDSDKEADNAGDENGREKRRKRREQVRAEDENVEVPKSDAEAQSRRKDRRPTRDEIDAANREEGRRVDNVPEFGIPDLIDAFTGNDRRRPRIDETRDRTVIDFGDTIVVRGDERPRLRRNASETYYEELSGGRSRETIERPNGVRVVTVYDRYGDVVRRSRIDRDGQEFLMIYAPDVDTGPRPPAFDVGDELPPMRLRIPVSDYIVDTSSEPDRDYYDFLAEPPVEQVERVYTIDEVKSSARVRDMVRRIDLDTITFATNSAEVPLSQAKTLRKVADAMLEVVEKDPGETFFIEGHTDAVGGDQPNLVLSDERAEAVASLLTEVYDIPAENLVTQGYGERFLKVRTTEAEQQNRRVTIRRVTPLVRPVAQK